MEEKDSMASGSHSLSETDSPPPVSAAVIGSGGSAQPGMNTAVSMMSTERSAGIGMAVAIIGGSGSGDLTGKKKRGRPRKYDADGNLRVPYVSPSPPGFTLTSPTSEFSGKRGRGRPPGSGNWQMLASLGELFANTAGGDFTPHVVTVYTGEDVASKILSFSQKGPRGICVLSANGAVSNVTIRQPGSSGGILTYEGRFEILSLTGSFTISDKEGMRSRTGGLSVSLAGPDGRVIGGGVAGLLMAASPIQIVVGSFMPNGFKAQKRKQQFESRMATVTPPGAPDTVTAATPISQAAPGGNVFSAPTSIHFGVQSHGGTDNGPGSSTHNLNNPSIDNSSDWNGSESTSSQRPSPDINVSVPVELN